MVCFCERYLKELCQNTQMPHSDYWLLHQLRICIRKQLFHHPGSSEEIKQNLLKQLCLNLNKTAYTYHIVRFLNIAHHTSST